MFRTEGGAAQVLDAYCAHLGAHLGVGGAVIGETIRCPFHAWQYGTDGACKTIPYSQHIPKAAAVKAWPTIERSGLVMVWHSPINNPPLWEPPHLTQYGTVGWSDYVFRQRYIVHTSVQEIVENVPDSAHFQFVHGNEDHGEQPSVQVSFDKHVMTALIHHNLPAYGVSTNFTVELQGLGLALNHAVGRGTRSFWTTYTPVDRKTVEVNFSSLVATNVPTDPSGHIGHAACQVTLSEFEKDIPIWENKIYRPNPLICRGDGPITKFRSWARQFYPSI